MSYFVERRIGYADGLSVRTGLRCFETLNQAVECFEERREHLRDEVIDEWCSSSELYKRFLYDGNMILTYVLIESESKTRQCSISCREVVDTMHDDTY